MVKSNKVVLLVLPYLQIPNNQYSCRGDWIFRSLFVPFIRMRLRAKYRIIKRFTFLAFYCVLADFGISTPFWYQGGTTIVLRGTNVPVPIIELI